MGSFTFEVLWPILMVALFLGSAWWKLTEFSRHKTHMASATIPKELRYQAQGETASITGHIGPYRIDVNTRLASKYSKHQHISVEGTLLLTDAPPGFCLSPEGAMTGIKRLGDQKEIEFDDPDFDNTFWVQADDPDRLREYLTEDRRKALIHWLSRMGEGSIENGVLSRKGQQQSIMDFVGIILGQFIGIAYAFQGDATYHASTAQLKSGWVATQKFRRLAFWTGLMALGFWVLPMEVHLPDWVVDVDHVLMVFSAATAVFAISGQKNLVVVLCTLLGFASSLAFLAVGATFILQGKYTAATLIISWALAWLICWIGTMMQMKSLKLK